VYGVVFVELARGVIKIADFGLLIADLGER